ncbi:uncharacterized protein LOC135499937 [Lineus longissimus]|uniref:uncharacterized protein LOC135499937 n=1 Tax=Lineus longissimus TaxID=88925 RepID=UPI00315D3BB0
MDLSKRDGFTLTGYLKLLSGTQAPIMEWPGTQGKLFGLMVWAWPNSNLYVSITGYGNPGHIFDMQFSNGVWMFFGLSYDKSSRKVIGYMDGVTRETRVKFESTSVAPDTSASLVNFGKRDRGGTSDHDGDKFLNGEMSCVMLFDRGLTADDMKRAKTFCDNNNNGGQGATFEFHSKAKIPSGSILRTHTDTPTIIKCMDFCFRDSQCASASFTDASKTCLTSSVNYFLPKVTLPADDRFELYCLTRPV